jgi:cyclic-di-GMP phosphodiesterase TipF (flagellum assembly factor)
MAELRLLKSLVQRLSGGERIEPAASAGMARTPAAVRAPGAPPETANGLDEPHILEIVRNALRDDRIEVVLQPIVSLPQRKRRFYECYTRLSDSDGRLVRAEDYIGVAERAGLITAIDNMLLFRCIQLVRKIQQKSESLDFFCNISDHTLADEDFFGDFVDYLETNAELAPNLVFEFAQASLAAHGPAVRRQLDRLRDLGVRFSLDQVGDLNFDAADLAARGVAFVKIECGLLAGDAAPAGAVMARLTAAGIDLIVEKIEGEEVLRDLLDYGIDFGQGYLFGEPRLARPAA